MIDFTSALYLDLKHSSTELAGWKQLTLGLPAALDEFTESREIGRAVANMQGLDAGLCAPSTLHIYWDLFGFLRRQNVTVFVDEKIYPVSLYGVERLYGSEVRVHTFSHLSANHLSTLVNTKLRKGCVPVVFTDGWCPQCGKPAPLNDYLQIVNPSSGKIIIDDTQAFGIFGKKAAEFVYGSGGGGLLRWLNVQSPDIISITSLAKAFGVPIAVISGNRTFIRVFTEKSETRVNSSPVSMAHLSAASNALYSNRTSGDKRRKKLWDNVSFFRNALMHIGINTSGGIFPVQSINSCTTGKAMQLFEKLNKYGIKTVLTAPHVSKRPSLSLIMRCSHSHGEIKKSTALIREDFLFGQSATVAFTS